MIEAPGTAARAAAAMESSDRTGIPGSAARCDGMGGVAELFNFRIHSSSVEYRTHRPVDVMMSSTNAAQIPSAWWRSKLVRFHDPLLFTRQSLSRHQTTTPLTTRNSAPNVTATARLRVQQGQCRRDARTLQESAARDGLLRDEHTAITGNRQSIPPACFQAQSDVTAAPDVSS